MLLDKDPASTDMTRPGPAKLLALDHLAGANMLYLLS